MQNPNDSQVTFEMQNAIDRELDDDEQVVWSGRQVRIANLALMIVPTLFGLVFTSFAVFWVSMALWIGGKNEDSFFAYLFPLFGVPFILVGLGIMTTPYWIAKRKSKTFYAITNRRAMTWTSGGFRGGQTIKSYYPTELQKISRTVQNDGSGDLIFDEYFTESYNANHGRRHHRCTEGFVGIADVSNVEKILRDTLVQG